MVKEEKLNKELDLFEGDKEAPTEKPLEDLGAIEAEIKAKEEPPIEEKPPRKRRRKKKEPEPEKGPMVEPDLMNMFILALTSILAKFLGGNWVARPQELPMLSKATDRWLAFHFPGIMEEHGPDVEMVTAWGLYGINRIDLPGLLAPTPPKEDKPNETQVEKKGSKESGGSELSDGKPKEKVAKKKEKAPPVGYGKQ